MAAKLIRPPLQREVKEELRRAFEHGEMTTFAAWRGEDLSQISREFNADNKDVESRIWLALMDATCAFNTSPQLGERFAAVWDRFIDRLRNDPNGHTGNLKQLRRKARKSLFEILDDALDELPMTQRIKAIEQAELDLANFKRGLQFMDMDSEAEEVSHVAS